MESGNRPVTGMRLSLEGKNTDRLAVHLQHLAGFPGFLRLAGEGFAQTDDPGDCRVPVRWVRFSHVCTCPVQHRPSRLDEMAHVVTKAWLEIKAVGPTTVLFLRLGFSALSARVRNSQWGPLTGGSAQKFHVAEPVKMLNSGVFAGGPAASSHSRLSAAVDTSEMVRGPDEPPGYWIVTGGKLCVDRGRVSLRVKYSILSPITEMGQMEEFPLRERKIG